MSTASESECVIVFDQERITFTRAALLNEPDNIFLTRFLGSSEDNGTKGIHKITIDGDPVFFRLIQAHLRGYEIFPLADGVVSYLSKEATLKTLLKLAEKFLFQNLRAKVIAELEQVPKQVIPKGACLLIKPHHVRAFNHRYKVETNKLRIEPAVSPYLFTNGERY